MPNRKLVHTSFPWLETNFLKILSKLNEQVEYVWSCPPLLVPNLVNLTFLCEFINYQLLMLG